MAEDLMEAQSAALQAQQEILENGEELKVTLRDSAEGSNCSNTLLGCNSYQFDSHPPLSPPLRPEDCVLGAQQHLQGAAGGAVRALQQGVLPAELPADGGSQSELLLLQRCRPMHRLPSHLHTALFQSQVTLPTWPGNPFPQQGNSPTHLCVSL